MLSNPLSWRLSGRSARLTAGLALLAGLGLSAGLAEPVYADSKPTPIPPPAPIQLDVSTRLRLTWTHQAAEYRVQLHNRPRDFGLRQAEIHYKIIDQLADCDATATWSRDLPRLHRNIILNKWKTKPNYLFLVKRSAIKYLGHKFCFRVSKAPANGQTHLDGYAEINIDKWWDDVDPGGVCASVYIWIDHDQITRGGQTTIHWKITNVRNPDSVRITARNHDYWFYDTAFAEPNIKKPYGNLHEVTSTYDPATGTITASRTVVGHLAPRTHNLYTVQVRQADGCGCPPATDAVFMRLVD